MPGDWIDVTVPLREGMVRWPGDPPVRIDRILALDRGDPINLSTVSMCLHAGTHIDAPLHFLRGAPGCEAVPLDAMIGPARVIAVRDRETVGPAELAKHRIRRGERVLLKTRNSGRCWKTGEFVPDFVHVTAAAAQYLAARGIRTVGIDYLSIGGFEKDGDEAHRILLEAGIWIIEGLDLSRVVPGRYDLICLPLRVPGTDGAPARALLRARQRR